SGTLSATGGSVTVTTDTLSGAGFALSGITFPVTIGVGQSRSFSVSFSPLATGTVSGALSFTSNASNTPPSITLSGSGAGLSVSPRHSEFRLCAGRDYDPFTTRHSECKRSSRDNHGCQPLGSGLLDFRFAAHAVHHSLWSEPNIQRHICPRLGVTRFRTRKH